MAYQLTVTSKDKPYNEIQNYAAFAAIKSDGSVVAWGDPAFGGIAPDNITDVKQIFSSGFAFAALKNDGSVVSWGNNALGGDSSVVSGKIDGKNTDVVEISSTGGFLNDNNYGAFAALKEDGSVVTWGSTEVGGVIPTNLESTLNSGVLKVYANNSAFAALKNDGSVVTWGDITLGGDSSLVATQLNGSVDVIKIFSTREAFAALKTDGSVVAWGSSFDGGNISNILSQLNGINKVKNIYSTDGAFAALREDGTVVTWGSGSSGGLSSAVQDELYDVVKIFSNSTTFAALRENGSVVTWGGDGGYVVNGISGNNNLPIFSTGYAFAAIKNDGSVVTWGDPYSGGEPSVNTYDYSIFEWTTIPLTENALVGVNKIFSTGYAFAALKNDGSVVTWGDGVSGGDSSSVPEINDINNLNFQPVSKIFTTTWGTFAALRNDGSVVTWGDSLALSSSQSGIVSFANATTDDNYVLAPLPILPPTPSTPTPPQPVVIENHAPTGSVSISGTPTQGQVLTVSNTLDDANGMGAVSYQWFNNSGAIQNATQTTYTLTQADVGKTFLVTASYIDGDGFSNSVASASTTTVANVNDAPTGAVVITGTTTQAETLSVSNTLADIDGLGTVSYKWFANGVEITGATAATFTLTQAEVGKAITAKANYTDGGNTLETVSSLATANVANINDAPTGAVTILGKPTQGQILTASNTLVDVDGVGVISYQWLSNNEMIQNATQTSYALTQADVGKIITVKANYTDGAGKLESVVSAATIAVINVNDKPTGSVVIEGVAKQNETLTVSNTLADTDGLGAISYQWQRSGSDIPSATQSTYVVTQADVDKTISVKASYIDKFDLLESVSSVATANIVNVNDAPTGTISILGATTQNQTLTANIDTLVDLDGIGDILYQWQRSGSDIPSATQSTYVLTQADVSQSISVKASYSDKFGTTESVSSVATAKIVDVNDKPKGHVLITGTPAQNHTLTASNDLSDLDGLGPISYQWLSNNTDISNATQTTYSLTQVDVGNVVTVRASYTDGLGQLESVIGGVDSSKIANENDSPKGNVSITGIAKKGHILSVSNTLTDVDGVGEIHYQWLNEGNVIEKANQASYELTQDDVGKNISVKASYTDLQKTDESVASTAWYIAANKVPTGAITIKGSAVWGATLSATSTLKDGDGPGKLSYSWQNDAGELSTSPSYKLDEDDIDTSVWLTVQYTDKKGNIEEVNSKPVDVTISTKSSVYNDILEGTAAADKLSGLGGHDTLVGGAGSDKLTGGKGADVFVFASSDFYTADSNGSLVFNSSVDTVADFNVKEYDVLDFGDLGELSFYSTLKDAQDDLASLFYVKGSGKIYLNTNNADGFTPTVIVIVTGKPAVNADFTDWNYPVA